jgi:hypothetical protein
MSEMRTGPSVLGDVRGKVGRAMKLRYVAASLGVASLVLIGAVGKAGAADEWFVIGEKTIMATDPSAEIAAEKGKFLKEDVKETKISVEGADVEISKVVLHWNNAKDDTITNVGIVKAGGQTAPKDAPTREGTLLSVAIQYKILNDAPSAHIKVWGLD